ncbi:MAG TPA: DNA-binding protein WhiA [Candidatus Limnocylindrales bacterium]
MTTAERDLVESIRAELAAVDPPRRCCRLAESAGLEGAFEPRRRTMARLELRLSRSRAGQGSGAATAGMAAAPSVPAGPTAGTAAAPSMPAGPTAASASSRGPAGSAASAVPTTPPPATGLPAATPPPAAPVVPTTPPPTTPPPFDWAHAPDHCRAAYLRGRFLAHGSLSLASGRMHLEFVLPQDEAKALSDQLSSIELAATWRIRRGRGVVTWKSVETVVTFLKVVGGGSALLELESRQVSRSVRGDINRVINAESANLVRAVAASARQIEAIDILAGDGRLAEQPYQVRLVADARREEPESTFSELAEKLGLHRSAVQRAVERIERLALHPDEGVGKRRAKRR